MKTEAPTPLTEAAERVARYEAALSEGQTQTAALEAAYGPIANLRSRGQTFVDATDKLCADLRSLLAERAALTEQRDRLAGALAVAPAWIPIDDTRRPTDDTPILAKTADGRCMVFSGRILATALRTDTPDHLNFPAIKWMPVP